MNLCENNQNQDFNLKVVETLSSIYEDIALIDLDTNKLQKISQLSSDTSGLENSDDAFSALREYVVTLASEDFIMNIMSFIDFSTLKTRLSGKKIIRCEFFAHDGHWRRASFIPSEIQEDGSIRSVFFCITVVDEEMQNRRDEEIKLKETLKEQSEMYNEMLQSQSAGVISYNTKTKKILMMNAASLGIFGWDCVGSDSIDFIRKKIISPKKNQIVEKLDSMTLMDDEISYEFAIERSPGNYIFVLGHTKIVMLSNKEEVAVSSFINITRIKKMERELIIVSQIDGLTKINNRASGERKVGNCLKEGKPGMFCLFDVDKFKSINDTYGHGTGDAVLTSIASCLKKSFRNTDVVMRLGGDEFSAFAVGITTEEEGSEILNVFYENLSKIQIEEMKDRKVTVSLGAVLFSKHEGEEETFDGLYQKADTAMYICKHNRGNRFGFYKQQ